MTTTTTAMTNNDNNNNDKHEDGNADRTATVPTKLLFSPSLVR